MVWQAKYTYINLRIQACHNVSVKKPEVFKSVQSQRDDHFSKMPDTARDDHYLKTKKKKKAHFFVCDNHFFFFFSH